MADLHQYLAILDSDPDDAAALAGLLAGAQDPAAPAALSASRKNMRDRGRPDVVLRLLDLELKAAADRGRRADLLLEKAQLLEDDLLDELNAIACLKEVLGLRDDETALELLEQIELVRANWQKVARKYVEEAQQATDRQLATQLFTSAAEIHARCEPGSGEVEQLLRRALEVEPRNRKAAGHLERLLRAGKRWDDLARLLAERIELSSTKEERVVAMLGLAEIQRQHLDRAAEALEVIKKVIALDPAQPAALKVLGDALEAEENWQGLVHLYAAAVKARRGSDREELAMLLQVAMILWRRIGDLDGAEEYFRRIRKVEPAHPAALDFYRAYYPARGEGAKLLQMLRQAEKGGPPGDVHAEQRAKALAVEIAELAEAQLGNPEKAIDAWKQLLRQDPTSTPARDALKRLYRRTEKWNALLDLMKEEIDRLPEADVAGRIERMSEVVEIYRSKLKLDVMVINALSAILKLDPDNRKAIDELADKYRQLAKWNDLIGVLSRKAELSDAPLAERVAILKEVADLWVDKFGNHAQAIKPLERILELAATDADTIVKLKDIYIKRRQWRQLINLLGKEAEALPPAEKRAKMSEMARLAAERVGDNRLAIELHNQVLGLFADSPDIGETLTALAALYDREKRWLAYAEILRRQRDRAATPADAVAILEKLGALLGDRVGAPGPAAEVFAEILAIDPGHTRSLRTLRELYAAAGDYDALEKLYGKLGQWDELVDAFGGIADRIEDRGKRLAVLERAAAIAERRAAEAGPTQQIDKLARVWERVLGVDPNHLAAAVALAPIYTRQEKWARLLPVLEVQLAAAPDRAARLARMLEIRELCEHRLGSRALAFTWAARAFEVDPSVEAQEADLLRLAHEPEQWRDVGALLERVAADPQTSKEVRTRVLRTAAKVAATRLNQPDRAREHERKVLELAPDDPAAVQHLEELAVQLSDWPALVASVERRAQREKDPAARADLEFRVAQLQEERLIDLDGAAETYERILAADPKASRALAALARLHEARADWEGLDGVLARQLSETENPTTPEAQVARASLLMRLGSLEEQGLDRPAAALGRYLEAVKLHPTAASIAAAERFLVDNTVVESVQRIAAAEALLPHLEKSNDAARLARGLELLRTAKQTAAGTSIEIDRRLLGLYDLNLGDPARAWDSAVRVLAADPTDGGVRLILDRLAAQLGREADLAKHLGTAFAARKAAGAPPAELRELAAELASLHGDRLGDLEAAEQDWLAVLDADPEGPDAFEALGRMYRGAERWTELRGLLERRADATMDDGVRKATLLELAALEDAVLADPVRAIAAYRRVLDVDPAHLDAYKALERLYADTGKHAELEDLLGRELDHVPEKAQVDLQYRRAELRGRQLGNAEGAVDLLEEVVTRRKGHADARELLEELLPQKALRLRVARILEPLYEADQLWKDLVMVLRAQHELAAGPSEAVELLARIAALEETQLANPRSAFDTWTAALGTDPSDERAREAIMRLAASLDRWPDAAAVWEKAVTQLGPNGDIGLRAALLGDLGTIYDINIGDSAKAIGAFRRLADADSTNPEVVRRASTSLARLFEDEERWGDLRDVLRKLAEWADSSDEKKALLARIAKLEEEKLSARDAALATWRDVLNEDPEDPAALDALERMYQASERWKELGEILRRRVEAADAPADKKAQLRRIAEIHEIMLEQPAEAIAAHLEVLDHVPDDLETLGELARLYRAAGRHPDLLETLERRLAVAEQHGAGGTSEAIELRFEIGNLLAGPLAREREALDRWADVLALSPDHPGALAAIEGALDDDDQREVAAELLRPLYETTAQDDKLAALLERLAAGADNVRDKLRYLREVAQIRERRLGDNTAAFGALVRALEVSVAEPELVDVLAEVDRLASELGRESDLIDIYRRVAPDVLDGDLQRRMYLDVADLARGVRDDVALAREHYQKVLDGQPDDRRSLLALESIHRETGEHARLWEILTRKADLATEDPDERVTALAEAAALCAGPLGRPDEAIAEWEQVLELAPERKDAVNALEQLYRAAGRWHDLTDLLERRLGYIFTVEEAVELRLRLGEIQEKELHDSQAAVESYAAALGGDPTNPAAIAALERFLDDAVVRGNAADVLEPLYVSRQQWAKLVRIYEIKLDAASDPSERLRLTRYIARLYEEQLEDLEGAAKWYARLFRENPIDPATRDQFQRLCAILENWKFLAETYQSWLDDESNDSPTVRDVALMLATVYDRRLDDVDRGQAAYRRALQCGPLMPAGTQPDDREVFGRLESMASRAARWSLLVEVYEEAIANEGELRRKAELMARMAAVLEERLNDKPRAIDAWREVLGQTAGEAALAVAWNSAASELDRLYRAESQWYDLAELIGVRIERVPADAAGDGRRSELRLALAEVLEQQLRDVPGAIDQYELVLGATQGWDKALPHLERLVVQEDHRERIAGLLEPVYRKWDWWQKLVVILDAKLEFLHDAPTKVGVLREIATIHDTRGGDLGLAFDALARAWKSEPSDVDTFDALTHQAARLGAWDDLVEVLETGVDPKQGSFDPDVVGNVHARIAEIHETQRQDHPAAIASWRRVLEQRPEDAAALSALDRLLAIENRADELVRVVERRAELAEDAGVRLVLLHRVASLYEEVLNQPREAILAFKNVLAVDDADLVALDALEGLYRKTGDPRELASTLARKIELAQTPQDRRALRMAAAIVHEQDLRDVFEAIAQLQANLGEDPGDAAALAELDRLHLGEKMWPELLEVIDRRAGLAVEPGARAELMFRAAQLVEKDLVEPADAIARYGAILQFAPDHAGVRGALEGLIDPKAGDDHVPAAGQVLEDLYRHLGDAEALVRLYERRLTVPGDPDERKVQWAALAEIHEGPRNDLAAATTTWARALAETPEDLSLFGPLERLAGQRGAWPELAAILAERLAQLSDPDLELAYATRLGQIHEDAIGDAAAAVDAYRRALGVSSDERPALAALDRVLLRSGRNQELTEILIREADAAPDDAHAADYLFRLGDVRETALADVGGAVAAYRDALTRVSQHRAARGSLERLLGTADDHRGAIIDVLEPIYEEDGDWPRLADLLAAKLSVTRDRHDRAAIYQRIAELSEQKLRDPVRALDAAGGWLVEDPSSGEALGEVERLAAGLGRWGEVAARLGGIVGSADLDREVRLSLLLRLGAVQLDRTGDIAGATATFGQALELEHDCQPALESLERIHRGVGDVRNLAAVLARRGELAYEPLAKRGAFAEVAELRERMGDLPGAVAAWKTVLELDETDREALGRLAQLHERAGEYRALVDVLDHTARHARDAGEEKAIRVRIAKLEGETIKDAARAVAAWQQVLDVDPGDGAALAALESAHAAAGDWLAVQEVLNRRLEQAKSSGEKVQILAAMAQVAEERRGSVDDAIGDWFAVLELDNSIMPAYDQLERLLAKGERWHDLVEILERRAEVLGTLGHSDPEIQALARAADIWEGPLDNPDAAGEILEKILRREPGSVTALTRLARIYERAADWDKCGEVLQKALALGPKGRDAADLFFRLGEVASKASGDLDTAGAHWRQALTHDPAHAPTIASLEKLARDRQDWATVADLLGRREATATGDAKLTIALELADVYQRLGQPAQAIPVLARASQAAPADVRILGPLADLYFAAGMLDEAAPIYDKLAEEAKAKRQMKDVAKYRQRQGGILEKRGDAAKALAAYEEAFRVNPGDIPTLAGLGRLHMAAKDWEKARKVYSALMLQNFGPETGLTKAEVYYSLGVIFLELGQPPKAKGMFQRGLEVEPQNQKLKDALAKVP